MSFEPYVILENHYGCHQSAVFCEQFRDELIAQDLSEEAALILAADREVMDKGYSMQSDEATEAWSDILEKFIPEEGYHLDYLPDDQVLFAVPD